MNEDLQQLLENLKLKTIAARFDEMLAAAESSGTPLPTFFAQLLRAEWHARQEQALQSRIQRAHFKEQWTLESFPFKEQKGVKERQIRTLAQLEFIPKAENIVFIGETGVGKTGLMVSLARKAVQNGYRALFIEAQDLFDEMYSSLADRSTRRLLRSLANVDVLAIDELGYANIKQEQTNIFFKLLEERHRRKPNAGDYKFALPSLAGLPRKRCAHQGAPESAARALPHHSSPMLTWASRRQWRSAEIHLATVSSALPEKRTGPRWKRLSAANSFEGQEGSDGHVQ